MRAHLGGGVYVSEHAKLSLNLSLAHETEHYLSNADVGRDLDGSGLVEARGQANFNESDTQRSVPRSILRAVGCAWKRRRSSM